MNHNGDLDLALRLVDAAASAGVDAVKFQTFVPELIASAAAEQAEYQRGSNDAPNQLEMLRELALPFAVHQRLKEHAEAQGLTFMSTPFDHESAAFLDDLGLAAFKISSGDITNLPLLKLVAGYGKPVLLSTGMSTLQEVRDAVDAIRSSGGSELALFHCVSNYPTAPSASNLRAVQTLRSEFSLPVGWSDHTLGVHVATAAIALGAELIEKHFTLDCGMRGPDHRASLEPAELARMMVEIRDVEAALGDGEKVPVDSELPIRDIGRKSICAARTLEAGHALTREDLRIIRPGTGIPPAAFEDTVGRVLARGISEGAALVESDLRSLTR